MMSHKGSTSSAGSSSSSVVLPFSNWHSRSLNRLMLTRTLSEFKKAVKEEKKIDIKRVEEDGTSLLHWFSSSGIHDIVEYLLHSGVPITKNKTNGQRPVHCAVDCNDKTEDTNRTNIVQALVEAGDVVDQDDVNGWTPLKLACRSGLYQCACYLLSHRADAEKRDREGNTALHDAVRHPNLTRLVISYVDDINMTNSDHDTPLILAVKSESTDSVSLLARAGADVNKENAYGHFPLWLAAQNKNTNIIDILIDAQADLNKNEPEGGTTALHVAAKNKTRQVCVMLVRSGADVDLKDKIGATALDYIVKLMPDMEEQIKAEAAKYRSERRAADLETVFGHLSVGKFDHLEQLLDDVPDVNVQVHGYCFIHMAVVHFQFDAVVLLQRRGADLNAQMHDSNTALHLSCQRVEKQQESLRILRFLVTSGVRLDIRNKHGETALFLAAGVGLVEHLRCLLESGADPRRENNLGRIPLHIACASHDAVQCIQFLLEKDKDLVNWPDGDEWTPLMYAAKTGCPESVKLLLDFGANVNIQEKAKGYTALYLAVIAKSLEICKMLITAGARMDVKRGLKGITAFHRAAMDELVDICVFFAEQGANIWQLDNKGNYPLDLVDSPRMRKRLEELLPVRAQGGPPTGLQSPVHTTANGPGYAMRVQAMIHNPPHISSEDPTPDSIRRRPIQFDASANVANGSLCEKYPEGITGSFSPKQCRHLQDQGIGLHYPEDIAGSFRPEQHLSLQDRGIDSYNGKQVVGSNAGCVLERPGMSIEVPPTMSAAHHSHLDPSQLVIKKDNVSELAAGNYLAMQQPVKDIEFCKDTTGRRRTRTSQPSPEVNFDKGTSIPLEERQSKAIKVVNHVARVVPSTFYPVVAESHNPYGQEESSQCRVPTGDPNLSAFKDLDPRVNAILDEPDNNSVSAAAAVGELANAAGGISITRDEALSQNSFKNKTGNEENSFDLISDEDDDSRNIECSHKEESLREEPSLAARGLDQPSQEDFIPQWQLEKDEVQTAKLIGSGGFGEVFDGKCRGRRVAIKMMRNRGGPLQDKIVETFFSEVEVMSKLDHEYVTEFVGACFDEDLYCIVTELMSKGSVFDLLHQKRTRLPWPRRVSMTRDAAKGMEYLHGLNVLHRDMKSMNLLVNDHWTVKVADFGLTRFKQHTQTMMSSTRGTPAYMAPELLRNQLVSEKIDVYAFGIVMSEIATRDIPFGDQNMNPLQLMFAVCQGSRPTLPSQDKAPRSYLTLARQCWNEQPDKRPYFSTIVQELTALIAALPHSKFS